AWKARLPGPGSSSPVIVGDRVLVTCFSGYGVPGARAGDVRHLKRHLVCVGRKDGQIRWQREVSARLPESPFQPPFLTLHGYASSTPVSDGKRVYVFFGK